MNNIRLMRWTLLFAAFMLVMRPSHSLPTHTMKSAPTSAVHTTYFMTPKDDDVPVHATVTVGKLKGGVCVYDGGQYDIGDQQVQTGDYVNIDASQLEAIVGKGYSCMSIYYFYQQPVIDTVRLVSDGDGYHSTVPVVTTVRLL